VPPPHPSAATTQKPPPIDKPGALADPRWLFVANDSANPLAASPVADATQETSASTPNNRMGGRWHPASSQSDTDRAPPPDLSHRWRHPGLEKLMARPADNRPDLRIAVGSSDPVVATNAAILLARQHDSAAYEPLLRAIRSNDTNTWQRCAAAEAFGELGWEKIGGELRRLVDEHGRFSGAAARTYRAELHTELLCALEHAEDSRFAQNSDASGEPRFAAALSSPAASVRREALLALAGFASGPLPPNISRYVGDPDTSVRRAALHTLAVRQHPEAFELLRQSLLDQDLLVRLAATAELGRLGGPQAVAELRRIAETGTELMRAAAVGALVAAGDDQIGPTAVGDKSWRVRRALVPILDRKSAQPPKDLAERLVADANTDVATAAVEAVGHWPLELSAPILLSGMEGRAYLTRKAAALQLAKMWPPAADFEIEAASPRRAAEMEQLRAKWRSDSMASGTTPATTRPPKEKIQTKSASNASNAKQFEANAREVGRLISQLQSPTTAEARAAAMQALVAFGPELPDLLGEASLTLSAPMPDDIFTVALPAASPEFAQIARLRSSDVRERRNAAAAIESETRNPSAANGPRKPLSRLALQRLAELMIGESDSLVWSSIFQALADDNREPAVQLAYAALSHPAPEVRRRACEYLAAHPYSWHAALLTQSLADSSQAVVEAAVRAIGRLPALEDPKPLEAILAAEDHALRVEAGESLARLGYPSGVAALERLGYDPAPKVRRLAAAAMGRVGDRSFVPVLVHLLDDRPDVKQAALAAMPHAAGRDLPPPNTLSAGTEPGSESRAVAETDQSRIQRWKDWYAAGQ
jgi:HEAT repeat protein